MPKGPHASDEFDSPWKSALRRYLRHFLAFFFPDLHRDIDWARGYESLDKELQRIARKAKAEKRLADSLFKVQLLDGEERWLLIHVEIQGDYEADFAERMAAYNLAVRAMYNQAVVSLAVLCDERRNWRPDSFSYGHGNFHTEVKFGIAKLLDYCQDVDALEADDNPFAAIVLAHWQTMQTRRDPETRTQWKLRIVKGLYRRQWTKEDVQQLFVLIDWVMALPTELEDTFDQKMLEFEEERKMVWISSMERYGMKRGREKGRFEGLLEAIALNLDTKFGAAGRRLLRKARALPDATALRRFTRFLAKTDDLEKVRAYFD